jgi:RimJ/RimL family protein N-acetyltransferase
MIIVRQVTEDDAEGFLSLARTLDTETSFMLLEPGERKHTAMEQRQRISELLSKENHTIIVAEDSGRLVGYVGGFGGAFHRNRHRVEIVIGILQDYAGQGLGRRLLEALERWARDQGLHRLELSVMIHNKRGIRLYEKMGFELEGTKRHSLLVAGNYVDEHVMAKLLE